MMHEQVYMCSRFIDQLHCLGRATPLQPAGALSDKTGRNTVPGTASKYMFRLEKEVVLSSVCCQCALCIRIFYSSSIHFLPLISSNRSPPCARVRWYMMEVSRAGRDVVNQFHQHQRPSSPFNRSHKDIWAFSIRSISRRYNIWDLCKREQWRVEIMWFFAKKFTHMPAVLVWLSSWGSYNVVVSDDKSTPPCMTSTGALSRTYNVGLCWEFLKIPRCVFSRKSSGLQFLSGCRFHDCPSPLVGQRPQLFRTSKISAKALPNAKSFAFSSEKR